MLFVFILLKNQNISGLYREQKNFNDFQQTFQGRVEVLSSITHFKSISCVKTRLNIQIHIQKYAKTEYQ